MAGFVMLNSKYSSEHRMLSRRGFVKAAGAAALFPQPIGAVAQDAAANYPNQTIHIIIPAAPGGTLDVIARLVGQKLMERLGQPVVVENKAGANTIVGTEYVSRSTPDGYTILCAAAASIVTNPAIYPKLRYSVADFAPLSNAASYPFVLSVANSVPAKTFDELLVYLKNNPDKANAGGSTAGHQLMTALFQQKTGVPVQYVPYRGMGEVVTGLMGGHIAMSFLTAANGDQINDGLIRGIAVTAKQRDKHFPGVPTTEELGAHGLVAGSWAGFFAPSRTPAPILAKLASEIALIIKLPDVHARFVAANLDPVGDTPQEFAATIASDLEVWSAVAKAADIKYEQ